MAGLAHRGARDPSHPLSLSLRAHVRSIPGEQYDELRTLVDDADRMSHPSRNVSVGATTNPFPASLDSCSWRQLVSDVQQCMAKYVRGSCCASSEGFSTINRPCNTVRDFVRIPFAHHHSASIPTHDQRLLLPRAQSIFRHFQCMSTAVRPRPSPPAIAHVTVRGSS
jgi:hypothetical protein